MFVKEYNKAITISLTKFLKFNLLLIKNGKTATIDANKKILEKNFKAETSASGVERNYSAIISSNNATMLSRYFISNCIFNLLWYIV